MPRKRPLPRQPLPDNDDSKVPKAPPTLGDETESPYFAHTAGGSEELDSQGEEHKAGTHKAKKPPSITVPDLLIAQSLPAQTWKPGQRLTEDFFDQECVTLAKALLGKVLVRVVDDRRVSARIVETESYLGIPDAASHSAGGKRTLRNEPMYMKAGTSYVYIIYGMYHCFNVVCKGEAACVLVRAAEPLEGLEVMVQGRGARRGANAAPLKPHQLCNGPSKLCQALALTKDSANKVDLAHSDVFWVAEEEQDENGAAAGGVPEDRIVVSTRIGIDSYGSESAKKPLRFYILGNKCVSVRDKQAEKDMLG